MKQTTIKIMAALACFFMLAAGKVNAQKDTIFLGQKLKEVTKPNGTALLHKGTGFKLYVTFKNREIIKLYQVDSLGNTTIIVDYTLRDKPLKEEKLGDLEKSLNMKGFSMRNVVKLEPGKVTPE
jgi:hypothetical protein